MYICKCTVTVRFSKEDVIEELLDKEEISEEDAENYEPTQNDIRAYAWSLIENDDGEYDDVIIH